jgi:hypothetical protein
VHLPEPLLFGDVGGGSGRPPELDPAGLTRI